MSDTADLSFVSTESLVDEIMARHTHVVLLTVRDGDVAGDGSEYLARYTKGPVWALIGLSNVFTAWGLAAISDSARQCDECGEPWDDDEDDEL